MSDINRSNRTSPVDTSTAQFAVQLTGMICGEDIPARSPLELRNDGRLYRFSAQGKFVGISPRNAHKGEPLTAYGTGVRFNAVDDKSLIPGKVYYVSANVGMIADAASANDSKGAFYACTASDLVVTTIGSLL